MQSTTHSGGIVSTYRVVIGYENGQSRYEPSGLPRWALCTLSVEAGDRLEAEALAARRFESSSRARYVVEHAYESYA